jgi:hypothetical protein
MAGKIESIQSSKIAFFMGNCLKNLLLFENFSQISQQRNVRNTRFGFELAHYSVSCTREATERAG